jgi:hypothetical protein
MYYQADDQSAYDANFPVPSVELEFTCDQKPYADWSIQLLGLYMCIFRTKLRVIKSPILISLSNFWDCICVLLEQILRVIKSHNYADWSILSYRDRIRVRVY